MPARVRRVRFIRLKNTRRCAKRSCAGASSNFTHYHLGCWAPAAIIVGLDRNSSLFRPDTRNKAHQRCSYSLPPVAATEAEKYCWNNVSTTMGISEMNKAAAKIRL